jgi:hypothetical protein
MATDTDGFGERLANVEGTVEQMDSRLGDMNSQIDRLDTRISDLRTDFRRWLIVLFGAMTLVFTVVSVVVQLLI